MNTREVEIERNRAKYAESFVGGGSDAMLQ